MLNWKAFIILTLINTVSVSSLAREHQFPFALTIPRTSESRALIHLRADLKRQVAGTNKGSLLNKDSTTNNDAISKANAARDLLRLAKAAALSIQPSFQRGLILDEIGAAEATAGDLDAAVETANQAYPHTYATLGAIGKQLGKSNDLTRAKSIVAKLSGDGASTAFAFMSHRQADDGKIDEAFKTVEQIEAPEVRSDALRWIAERQAANGDYDGTRKTMAMAKAADPNRRSDANDVEMLVLEGQLRRGDLQAARATIASVKSPEMKFAAMLVFAEAFGKREKNAAIAAWMEETLKALPAEPRYDFDRYFAIPIQVKIGQKDRAMLAAGALSPEFRLKGYNAVAVTCAEMKDSACVNAALDKMTLAARNVDGEERFSDFRLKTMILNVTAALIDHGDFDTASRWIATVERNFETGSSRRFIQPATQLQRVVMLAQQNRFIAARLVALKMRANSIDEVPRGTALRITALLETRNRGIPSSARRWALLLKGEDRAYALLGNAQALLDIGEVKLPYAAIQIH